LSWGGEAEMPSVMLNLRLVMRFRKLVMVRFHLKATLKKAPTNKTGAFKT
jgi:hypothetical protein